MGEGEIIYLSLHCQHQNDSCIKMGSDKSHFKVSLSVRDKVTRQCPQTTTFEEKGKPTGIRTEVPLLTSLTRLTARPNWLTAVYSQFIAFILRCFPPWLVACGSAGLTTLCISLHCHKLH